MDTLRSGAAPSGATPSGAVVVGPADGDGRTGDARALARRWRAVQLVHDRADASVERALQAAHGISVREFALLDALSDQFDGPGGHLQMKDVADAVALSQSATTRLVARLEDRGLLTRYICSTDRRGIYTDVTPAGLDILAAARPVHDEALAEALDRLAAEPSLAPLVGLIRAGLDAGGLDRGLTGPAGA